MESPKKRKEFTIDEVIIQPKKVQPIFVNFQNGTPTEEVTQNYKYNLFQDGKKRMVLGISDDRIVYKGYRPDSEKELMRTMIGIYNKKTGAVKLIDCEQWEVTPALGKIPDIRTDFYEGAIAAVNKEFGSKKVKRRTEQYEKMQINVDSVKEQLESAVANIELDNADLVSNATDDFTSNNVPRCNREAVTIFDIYDLYDIVPNDILKTLYDYTDNVKENGFEDNNEFFSNILDLIEKGPKQKKKLATLIYLRTLCKWLELPMKEARKVEIIKEKFNVSAEVANKIINTYTIQCPNGRQRPPMAKDKAIIDSMILTLTVNCYTINLEDFAKAINIRLSTKRLTDFAKLLCLTPSKQKNIFSLRLPLPKPPPPVTAKRNRKN